MFTATIWSHWHRSIALHKSARTTFDEMMMLDSKKFTLVIGYLLTHLTFHHHASLWQIGRPNLSVQKFGRCVSLSRYTGGKPFYERKTTCIIIGENDQRNMFICTCSLLYLSEMMFIHILGYTESFGQLHDQDKGISFRYYQRHLPFHGK